MKTNVLLIGGFGKARALALSLIQKGYHVAAVNACEADCRALAEIQALTVIRGDGTRPFVLEDAGARDADIAIALTPRDDDNLVICQLCKKRFQVDKTVALIGDPPSYRILLAWIARDGYNRRKAEKRGCVRKGVFCRAGLRFALMALLVVAASALGYGFRHLGFPETNIVLVYLLAVVTTAWLTDGFVFGILASIAATLTFNYLFTAPTFTLSVDDPSYLITFAIMTVTALITSMLTSHVKQSAQEATAREADTKAVYALTSRLTAAGNEQEIAGIAVGALSASFACRAGFACFDERGEPEATFLQQTDDGRQVRREMDEPTALKARLLGARLPDAGEFTDYPVRGAEALLGAVRIPREKELDASQRRLLQSMTGSIALAMDRLRGAEQRIRLREEAEQERYRSNLLRAISHDLRTPLAGIMGTSEMLMDMTRRDDPRYALAEGVYRDADWLHALVENILSLTRLQEGRLQLNLQPEALEEVIGAAVGHIAKRAPGREIAVRVPEELLIVPMDAKLIEQVLVNLLDNALKHTPPKAEIAVTASRRAGFARVTVADRGSGIRKEDLPHIFRTFYTSKDRRPDAAKGVGLGLSICDAIVRAHGGTIEAHNREDGPGAQFDFTLPLQAESQD